MGLLNQYEDVQQYYNLAVKWVGPGCPPLFNRVNRSEAELQTYHFIVDVIVAPEDHSVLAAMVMRFWLFEWVLPC